MDVSHVILSTLSLAKGGSQGQRVRVILGNVGVRRQSGLIVAFSGNPGRFSPASQTAVILTRAPINDSRTIRVYSQSEPKKTMSKAMIDIIFTSLGSGQVRLTRQMALYRRECRSTMGIDPVHVPVILARCAAHQREMPDSLSGWYGWAAQNDGCTLRKPWRGTASSDSGTSRGKQHDIRPADERPAQEAFAIDNDPLMRTDADLLRSMRLPP